MRITGGSLRGRTLKAPEGLDTRPTTDRVREALFNVLAHHDWGEAIGNPLIDAVVLDAFAGTGALGLEALSRGAASASFFEKDRKAQNALRDNIAKLKVEPLAAFLPMDVTHPPQAKAPATLIFLDPPYHKELIPTALAALAVRGWIAPNALVSCETAKTETLTLPDAYTLLLEKTYGATKIGFYSFSDTK